MSPQAVIQDDDPRWALFLDVDGTLLEIAETPQAVHASDRLKKLLSDISVSLDGALALVSGRSIADLDRLFAPHRFCAAGVHGFERRDASGRLHEPACDPAQLDPARVALGAFVRAHHGLLLEDKGHALAVHYRLAPQLCESVHCEVTAALDLLGPDYVLQRGKCVFEIRARIHNKGTGIAAFMREPPFHGRTPVFAGDDVTDEDGFASVNAMDGVSIQVGGVDATIAGHRLGSVADVVDWLAALPGAFEARTSVAARLARIA